MKAFDGHIPYKLLFTGQHVDLLSGIDKEIITVQIRDGFNRLDSIVSSLMNLSVFDDAGAVLVQGDTTSAFAVGLAAFHRKLKVVHLEAGLRTYNNDHPYPEEFNRRALSCMADINLCPTSLSAGNLETEKAPGKIHIVGNTVLDNLLHLRNRKQVMTNKVVITMHRRENHSLIESWFSMFDNLAKDNPDLEFIIPIHPNPNVKKHRKSLKYVNAIDPLGHKDFIDLLASSMMVITDSGGLQEESSFLGKKCIVCREETERPEGIGTFSFLCPPDLQQLEELFYMIKNNPHPPVACPYGDGHSGERIRNILMREL